MLLFSPFQSTMKSIITLLIGAAFVAQSSSVNLGTINVDGHGPVHIVTRTPGNVEVKVGAFLNNVTHQGWLTIFQLFTGHFC